MPIEVKSDSLIRWTCWQYCFDGSVLDDFNCATISYDCIISLFEGVKPTDAFDFEIFGGGCQPAIFCILFGFFDVICGAVWDCCDYAGLVSADTTPQYTVKEVEGVAIKRIRSPDNFLGGGRWRSVVLGLLAE